MSDAHSSAGNAAIGAELVIAHHNATLTNISSFGPRVQAIPHHELRFADDTTEAAQVTSAMRTYGVKPAPDA